MVKICRSLANDKNREGIRTAAWNILLRAHSLEKDDRVLEALKVGQVCITFILWASMQQNLSLGFLKK